MNMYAEAAWAAGRRDFPNAPGHSTGSWPDYRAEIIAIARPAVTLYARSGFHTLARIADMLQIDGVSHDLSYMSYRLR